MAGITFAFNASEVLGRQFARLLSSHGAAVALAARQAAKLHDLEAEIRAKGGRAAAVQMDVTDMASIGRAIEHAEAKLGPISVLINNAGIAVEKLAVDQTEADWDAVIGANLKGAYFTATEIARRMIARHEGVVVLDARPSGYDDSVHIDHLHLDRRGAAVLSADVATVLAAHLGRADRGSAWVEMPAFAGRTMDDSPAGLARSRASAPR